MSLGQLVVYEVEVELLSPTILVERTGKSGYTSIRDRLPGQTLRGALLTALHDAGIYSDPRKLAELRITATTGLPGEEGASFYFGHPFVMVPKVSLLKDEKKGRRYAFSLLAGKWLEELRNVGAKYRGLRGLLLSKLREYREAFPDKLRELGEDAHAFSPSLLEFGVGDIFKVDGKGIPLKFSGYPTSLEISVGISHVRGASESGMIFAYEALPTGAKFSARLTDMDGGLTDLMADHGLLANGRAELLVRIGRGASRGFGHAVMRLRKLPEEELRKVVERADRALNEGVIPLLARAPLVELRPSTRGLVSLPSPPEEIKVPGEWHASLELGGRLMLKRVDCLGKQRRVKGYSMRKGIARPEFTAACEGSLCLYKVARADGDVAEALALLELAGLDRLAKLCLNRVEIAVEDPFPSLDGLLRQLRDLGVIRA